MYGAKSLTDRHTDNRNYGIDLLRLIAMFMVVILHVLGQGGVISATTGLKHHIAWLLETTAYCAVDCYAIISGFVAYSENEKPYRYTKFFGFWLQAFIYSFGITLLAFLLKPNSIGIETVIKSCFPVASEAYWYVSAYAGLFFIIPWLNKLMRSCNTKEATCLIAILIFIFVGYVTFSNFWGDCFRLEGGYSFVWLSILYLVGAWLKKCDIPKKIRNSFFFLGSAICIAFSWFAHEFIPISFFGVFVNFTSFTIVFVAISLVCVFSKLHFNSKSSKVIAFFAPAAFGVYLIHVQPLVWRYFMSNAFVWIADFTAWLLPILVLGSAFCLFVICLLIEKLRLILFKLLKINQFTGFIEKKLDYIVHSTFDKVTSREQL